MRLPSRRRRRTRRPCAAASGGSTVRSRNGLARRTRSSGWSWMRLLQRFDVERHVGQLRHGRNCRMPSAAVPRPATGSAAPPARLSCALRLRWGGTADAMATIVDTTLSRAALQALIDRLPRVKLTDLPTPLEGGPRLTAALGGARICQARRPDRAGVRRQQDPQARVPDRGRAVRRAARRGRRRRRPVEPLPTDRRGGAAAGLEAGLHPGALASRSHAAGQPAARRAARRRGARGRGAPRLGSLRRPWSRSGRRRGSGARATAPT